MKMRFRAPDIVPICSFLSEQSQRQLISWITGSGGAEQVTAQRSVARTELAKSRRKLASHIFINVTLFFIYFFWSTFQDLFGSPPSPPPSPLVCILEPNPFTRRLKESEWKHKAQKPSALFVYVEPGKGNSSHSTACKYAITCPSAPPRSSLVWPAAKTSFIQRINTLTSARLDGKREITEHKAAEQQQLGPRGGRVNSPALHVETRGATRSH